MIQSLEPPLLGCSRPNEFVSSLQQPLCEPSCSTLVPSCCQPGGISAHVAGCLTWFPPGIAKNILTERGIRDSKDIRRAASSPGPGLQINETKQLQGNQGGEQTKGVGLVMALNTGDQETRDKRTNKTRDSVLISPPANAVCEGTH